MADLRSLANGQNAALVVLSFLQADCKGGSYKEALLSLGEDLTRDINSNGPCADRCMDDGAIESDGHLSSCSVLSLGDIEPSVDLHWPENPAEAAALQQVASGLRDIAAQLERNVVDRATQNLSRSIFSFPRQMWNDFLRREVEQAMRQGVGLEHLPQERVAIALSLTLVKGVCERAPHLLRDLFNTALQYITPGLGLV